MTPKDTDSNAGPAVARSPQRPPLIRNIAFWLLAALALVLFLYVFSSILLPFLAGMVLAYFLDPVADRLERMGLSRTSATVVILIGFVVVLAVGLMIVVPVLGKQLADFASRLPEYLTRLHELMIRLEPKWVDSLLNGETEALRENLTSILAQGTSFLGTLFKSVWSSGVAIVNVASLFVVTPVVAFYMLLDWDRMVERVDALLPRDHQPTIRRLARDINAVLEGFVRGQVIVCLVLGVIYAVGLTVVGLKFGLIVGILAGIISFIPYLGTILGFIIGVALALFQFWPDYVQIGMVVGVFAIGQFIEGNFLSPKLVGNRVGLHPVWVMFAIFAFAALFGFVGALLALPIAAALGVLARFGIGQYRKSKLYLGDTPGAVIPPRDTDS